MTRPESNPPPAGEPQRGSLTDHPALITFIQATERALNAGVDAWHERMSGVLERTLEELEAVAARLGRDSLDVADQRNAIAALLQALLTILDDVPGMAADDRLMAGWWDRWCAEVDALPETLRLECLRDDWFQAAGRSPAATVWQTARKVLNRPKLPVADGLPEVNRAVPFRDAVTDLAPEPISRLARGYSTRLLDSCDEWLRHLHQATFDTCTRFSMDSGPDAPEEMTSDEVLASLTALRTVAENGRGQIAIVRDEIAGEVPSRVEEALAELRQRWSLAGTLLYRVKRFDDETRARTLARVDERTRKPVERRRQLSRGRQGNVAKDFRLLSVVMRHAGMTSAQIDRLRHRTREQIEAGFGKVRESVGKARDTLTTDESDDPFRQRFRKSSDRLRVELIHRQMPALVKAVIEFNMAETLSGYLGNVRSLLTSMAETEPVYVEKTSLGAAQEQQVPFRDIVRSGPFADLDTVLVDLRRDLEDEQGQLIRGISELDDVLSVNLSAVHALLEEAEDGDPSQPVLDAALEGLDRLQNRVGELEKKARKYADSGTDRFSEAARRFEERILELTDNQNLLHLRLQLMQGEVRGRYWRRSQRAVRRLAGGVRAGLRRIPTLVSWGQSEVQRLRRLTGIAEADQHAVSRLATFLRETEDTIAGLPFVYKELFRIRPLDDDRFFSGRDRELAALHESVTRWRAGGVAATAVIGEQGSGRTSLLHIALAAMPGPERTTEFSLHGSVLTETELARQLAAALEIDPVDTLDALEEALLVSDERRICVFENLQHIFLRTVDGFDLLDRFLLLMSLTSGPVLWILSCTLNTWTYLDRVLQVSRSVQSVIRLDSLSEDQLRGIIERRHSVSGFRRIFELSAADKRLRRVKRTRSVSERQQVGEDLFFERLQDIAAGNVAVALLFYLRSVVRVKGDTLVFTTDLHLDDQALQGLATDERFTLAAVVIHDGLTEDEHARVFRQTPRASRITLHRLTNQGVLVRQDGDFRLHPTLHRPVIRALRQVNILH